MIKNKKQKPFGHKPRDARNGGRADQDRSDSTPSYDHLVRLFQSCGLDLPPETLQSFWEFHRLLKARKDELDLTRLHSFESLVTRHYIDCALVATLTDLPSPLLDIGTGAGFPGVPLKLMRPDLHIILAESRGRRLQFLEEACQVLKLSDMDIYPHQITDRFDTSVAGIITRDLEPIGRTLERAAGFLPVGGRAIFMKGPGVDDDLNVALEVWGGHFRLVDDRAYTLGQTTHKRRLIVLERTSAGRALKVTAVDGPQILEIASIQNQNYKMWTKLQNGRGVKKHGLSIMSGLKQVVEVLRDFPKVVQAVLIRDAVDLPANIPPDLTVYRLRSEMFRELDWFDAGPPLLLVQVPAFPTWDGHLPSGCTLMVPFQDPTNVGAVIRSATALGGTQIVLLEEAAHPYHPRSLRAAGPPVFRVPLLGGPSIHDLSISSTNLVTLGTSGQDLWAFRFPQAFGLLPGLEGPGLPEHLRTGLSVTIPMAPGVESLNAATATALAMYEWRRQQQTQT